MGLDGDGVRRPHGECLRHTGPMKHPRVGILGGIAALAVGIGVAAAGVGHLLQSIPPAHAAEGIGPTVTGGVHPWVNISGLTDGALNDTTIYTVPADRVLVITGGCSWNTFSTLQQDGDIKVHYLTRLLRCDDINDDQDNGPNLVRSGNAHLVFEPGSQVIIHHDVPSTARYYFEGYLAHP